ncbi:MAG: 5-oxoprolinase subunit PxpA [Planctomycetota bacterium]
MTAGPRPAQTIDLNADVGEASTRNQIARELAVMQSVTSVNIACGGHAGDEASIRRCLLHAKQHGLAAGAHPSYPDRENFGRVAMQMDMRVLQQSIIEQLSALAAVAESEGVPISHCKPHGALYHAASVDADIATAIFRACAAVIPRPRLVCLAGSPAVEIWRRLGADVLQEAFADRVYEPTGALRSRSLPGSVISHPQEAAEQALCIAKERRVRCADGGFMPVIADTLCIHADTPNAAGIARQVRTTLEEAGVVLTASTACRDDT